MQHSTLPHCSLAHCLCSHMDAQGAACLNCGARIVDRLSYIQMATVADGAGGRRTPTSRLRTGERPSNLYNSHAPKLNPAVYVVSGGNGDGWRWWREEDPYWPLRDWGDHPMRWWTWGLAAALAGERIS